MTMRLHRAAAVAALLILAVAPARAEMAVNGGFESSPTPPDAAFVTVQTGSTAITGWTVTHAPINVVDGAYWVPVEGQRSLGLNATSNGGGIAQLLTTQPGSTYQVRFNLSGEPFTTPTLKTLRVSAAGQQHDFTFDTSSNWHWAMGWVPCTWTFVASTSSTMLELLSLTVGAASPALDSVSVTLVPAAAVPGSETGVALAATNPARGGTRITYALPAATRGALRITDVSGRTVATLAEGLLPAGRRTVGWNAPGGAAGIYFVTLRLGDRSLTRRVTLLP